MLRAGALAAVAAPLIASGCTDEPAAPPPPDPLADLAARARADAAAAQAVAGAAPELAAPAGEIARLRTEHAVALQAEVDRARPPSSAPSPAPPVAAPPNGRAHLLESLRIAEEQAAALVPTVPRHRAGLLGSVVAGCAGLREVFA
ncbi:hypothetical protein EV193_1163 [Herbihabitans rhizosphaerae]|uniref:Uncharacterized protein n=1 Tax=Herbihabitans rhizosphaerae TaxID=1872711 RepID=A0A4Q7KCN9_9PSEU|nr:hypothetical protein [Herbihabitans rhizosphaerae]RZS30483.1 hypothetical protein EV193_1163 [Herbihabitans rhizosphaerae]